MALEHRNSTPMMLRLLSDHFRKICEAGAFYSLPLRYIDAMGGDEVAKALQKAPASCDQATLFLTMSFYFVVMISLEISRFRISKMK